MGRNGWKASKIGGFSAISIFFSVFFTILVNSGSAQSDHIESQAIQEEEHLAAQDMDHTKTGDVDIAAIAFGHILDQHSWHLWGEGHESVAIPLPVIIYSNKNGLQIFSSSKFEHGHAAYNGYRLNDEKIVSSDPEEKIYDLSITKNVAQLLLSALALVLIFISIAKAYKKHGVTSVPRGKQSFLEPLIVFVRDDIARQNIGSRADKYTPYLLTVFFLILINNLFGLVPISANLTGNIAFTMVLAFCTLVIVNVNANKHYWGHIFMPHAPKALWIILIPLEFIGILTKPFALMIRLFANITAGHMIIISLISLIFLFKSLFIAPVSLAFALFIDVLEVLVAVLQAYIFTLLTSLFIGSAITDANQDGAHTREDEMIAEAGH